MRIAASSTISYQPTFQKKGFSLELGELGTDAELISPDYTHIIPAMDRRRMSEVLKMGIACSTDCLKQAGLEQPDAIIVGTSMGCCTHTKNFLDKIKSSDGSLISPTAFIQSTHNTIAGQISLHLRNHSYNMTHTQNSLSFEQALLDSILCLQDGHRNVLVGAADEFEDSLYNMKARLCLDDVGKAMGSSFFILENDTEDPSIHLVDVLSYGLIDDISPAIINFLKANDHSVEQIDLVLYSSSHESTVTGLKSIFTDDQLKEYQQLSGIWLTNSAFAMSYGVDLLSQGSDEVNTVLICNNLIPENLGLVLLNKRN